MQYFSMFPTVEYCDNQVVNIMARNKIIDAIKNLTYVYYEYTVKDYERPDILANTYYGNYKHAWLIFYANDIYDPIREWVLSERDFTKYLNYKYREENYSSIWNSGIDYKDNDTVIYQDAVYICIANHTSAVPGELLDSALWYRMSETLRPGFQIANQTTYEYRNRENLIVDWDSWYFDVVTEINATAVQSNYDWSQYLTNSQVVRVINENDVIYNITMIPIEVTPGHWVATFSKSRVTVNLNRKFNPNQIAFTVSTGGSKRPISAYTNEWELNEKLRHIKLIDKNYAPQIIDEFKKLFS